MNHSQTPNHHEVLLSGDYYASATGPAIILFLSSPDAAQWLDDLLKGLGKSSKPVTLTDDPHVCISNLAAMSLVYRDDGRNVELRNTSSDALPRFTLFMTEDGVTHIRGLIQPFIKGERGHQYLTVGGVDDALVELSFGEDHSSGQP